MVAAQNEAVTGAAADGFHALPIGLNASGLGIMESPAVHRAPKICVKFEIAAAPFLAHGAENLAKMLLNLRMRAIKCVPGTVPPSAKRYLAGEKRLIIGTANEPLG